MEKKTEPAKQSSGCGIKGITAIVSFALGLGICYVAFTLGQVYEKNPDKSQRIDVQVLLDQLKSNNEEIRKKAAGKLQEMRPDMDGMETKLKEVVRDGADKANDAYEWVSKKMESGDTREQP